MAIVDEDGNVFGVVNVIDALVVLVALAVVVAGFALVSAPDQSGSIESRYVTIDLGTQPEYVVESISPGDVFHLDGISGNLTVTDVYASPVGPNRVSVMIRVAITGRIEKGDRVDDQGFLYDGRVIKPGLTLPVMTGEYSANGTVTAVEKTGKTFATENTTVRLSGTAPVTVLNHLDVGDTYEVTDSAIARVSAIYVGPARGSAAGNVVVDVELVTINRSDEQWFARRPLELGRELSLDLGTYRFAGQIDAIEPGELAASSSEVTVQTTVPTTVAERLEAGATFEIAGRTVATLQSVTLYPTGKEGQKRAMLDVRMLTVERNGQRLFGEHRLTIGSSIPFETGEYSITGTVVRNGSRSSVGTTDSLTALVKLRNVAPEMARAVRVGMTEQVGGRTSASVVERRVEPAVVVLTSEDGNIYQREHPRRKDVYLTVRLEVRRTPVGTMFHGRHLQLADRIVLDFGTVTVEGTVVEFEPE